MRARTPKRAKEEAEYKKLCNEIDKEARTNGCFVCFFCGGPLKKGEVQHHHLEGRENDLLTDKDNIILAHPICHSQFHDLPVRKHTWRETFLEKLREKNPRLYYKEREKENK